MNGAREDVLARVRAALGDVPGGEAAAVEPPTPSGPAIAAGSPPVLARFEQRVADYRGTVVRCGSGDAEIAEAVARICVQRRAERLAVPHDLPLGWLPASIERVADEPGAPLTVDLLDTVPGVLTSARLGIAETGTLVLDHGPGQGRRALTLVPDLHLCVVAAAEIVDDVPEAFRRLGDAGAPARCTFVSGPSATSDIELERVEGVHGPRTLVVILAG